MITNILAPTDGSEHGDKAVRLAGELASKHGARLHLFHVLLGGAIPEHLLNLTGRKREDIKPASRWMVSDYDTWMASKYDKYEAMIRIATSESLPTEVLVDIADKLLARAKDEAQSQGVEEITLAHAAGSPAPQILKRAQEVEADTIVLGSRGLSSLAEVSVGSVCHQVQRLFPGTVVTVR